MKHKIQCIACGVVFEAESCRRKYCRDCAERRNKERHDARSNLLRQVPAYNVCEYCGKKFLTRNAIKRFCSTDCRYGSHRNGGLSPAERARIQGVTDNARAKANDAANGEIRIVNKNGRRIEIRGHIPGRLY